MEAIASKFFFVKPRKNRAFLYPFRFVPYWNGSERIGNGQALIVVSNSPHRCGSLRRMRTSSSKTKFRSKNLKARFYEMGDRVRQVYHADTRRTMSQRIRRLSDWAKKNLSGIVLAKTLDLCAKRAEWSLWYDYPNAYRTSNELDRLMRSQNRYFERGQHFHGSIEASNVRSRSWAVLYNYWDWGRKTRTENDGDRCPAERLNGKRYAENWLENLLAATYDVPKRKPPQKTA